MCLRSRGTFASARRARSECVVAVLRALSHPCRPSSLVQHRVPSISSGGWPIHSGVRFRGSLQRPIPTCPIALRVPSRRPTPAGAGAVADVARAADRAGTCTGRHRIASVSDLRRDGRHLRDLLEGAVPRRISPARHWFDCTARQGSRCGDALGGCDGPSPRAPSRRARCSAARGALPSSARHTVRGRHGAALAALRDALSTSR